MIRRVTASARKGWRAVRDRARSIFRSWRIIALVLGYLLGWALLTWAGARLLVPEVWLISGGLLCWALSGFGLARDIATQGLYVLSLRPKQRGDR